jgi:hypothetical protein
MSANFLRVELWRRSLIRKRRCHKYRHPKRQQNLMHLNSSEMGKVQKNCSTVRNEAPRLARM